MTTLCARIHDETSLGAALKGYLLDKGTEIDQETRPVHVGYGTPVLESPVFRTTTGRNLARD
jgi:hypothetical protein